MTIGRCKKGCVKADGSPEWHPGKWACPKENEYDPGKLARFKERKEAARKVANGTSPIPGQGSTPSGAAPAPATGAAAPAPGDRQHTALHDIELGSRVAETSRRQGNEALKDDEWELPSDSSQTFFETFSNGVGQFCDWLDDLLLADQTEEGRLKKDVWELGPHETSAARGSMGRRISTKVVKGLGAKTQAEGIETVDSLAFVSMFFLAGLQTAGHFIRLASQSPRLKKLRDDRDKKQAEREAAKKAEEQRRRSGQPPAGTPPAAGGT